MEVIWSYLVLKVISESNKDLCLLKCEKCEAFLIKYGFIKYKHRKLWIYTFDLRVDLYVCVICLRLNGLCTFMLLNEWILGSFGGPLTCISSDMVYLLPTVTTLLKKYTLLTVLKGDLWKETLLFMLTYFVKVHIVSRYFQVCVLVNTNPSEMRQINEIYMTGENSRGIT